METMGEWAWKVWESGREKGEISLTIFSQECGMCVCVCVCVCISNKPVKSVACVFINSLITIFGF